MKRGSILAAGLAVAFLAACEGDTGPVGPAGLEGPEGPPGPPRPAGQAATLSCTECHSNDVGIVARQVQYEASVHRQGGNFERSTASCAGCHTHQGFMERLDTGASAASADVDDPAPVNCRTCHQIHTTNTAADYALTTEAPVTLQSVGEATVDLGEGNLCASCHQGRALSPEPRLGGGPVEVTSIRFGFHHGPQADVVGGRGAYEFAGPAAIAGGPSVHGDGDETCVRCHMGTAYGSQPGGHTWKMTYEYHGSTVENVAGCNTRGCHTTVTSFATWGDVPGRVSALLDELGTELLRIGIYSVNGFYATPGEWPTDVAAAFCNWQMFSEDRSMGLHNPPYVVGVLRNSLEKMKAY